MKPSTLGAGLSACVTRIDKMKNESFPLMSFIFSQFSNKKKHFEKIIFNRVLVRSKSVTANQIVIHYYQNISSLPRLPL